MSDFSSSVSANSSNATGSSSVFTSRLEEQYERQVAEGVTMLHVELSVPSSSVYSNMQSSSEVNQAIHDEFNQFLRNSEIQPNRTSTAGTVIDLASQSTCQLSISNTTQNSVRPPTITSSPIFIAGASSNGVDDGNLSSMS